MAPPVYAARTDVSCNRTCPWRRGTTRDENGSARSLRSQISSSLRTLQSLNDLKGFSKGRAAAFENLSPQRVAFGDRQRSPAATLSSAVVQYPKTYFRSNGLEDTDHDRA